MKFLNDGNVDYTVKELISLIKMDKDINNLYSSDEIHIKPFNDNMKIFEDGEYDFSKKKFNHKERQNEWFIPEKYKNINLYDFLIPLCKNDNEKNRIEYELKIYKERNLFDMLRFMIFLIDYMRNKKIVWGVGRGSSVCSYVLYKIGIHKIDSVKYDLDFKEFLK